MNKIHEYQNGDFIVEIYDDGTKQRKTHVPIATAKAAFPDSIDIKITNFCDKACIDYAENSVCAGNIANIIHNNLITDIKPYTEVSIIDCNPLAHPALVKFIEDLSAKHIDVNLTINQKLLVDDINNVGIVYELVAKRLIRCLTIPLTDSTDTSLCPLRKVFSNIIVEVVNGIVTSTELDNLSNHDLSLMIVGFNKKVRTGCIRYNDHGIDNATIEANVKMLKDRLLSMPENAFKTIGFDIIAAEQLNVKDLLNVTDYYIHDDGKHSMYIDFVAGEYSKLNTDVYKQKIPVTTTTLSELFNLCHYVV